MEPTELNRIHNQLDVLEDQTKVLVNMGQAMIALFRTIRRMLPVQEEE